jgi:hypothetical protein
VSLDALNAKLLLGEDIDLGQYMQASSTMVRIGSRLGLQRRARDVSPSLADIMREHQREVEHD